MVKLKDAYKKAQEILKENGIEDCKADAFFLIQGLFKADRADLLPDKEIDFKILGLTFSPVKGPEGNIEFLAHLTLADTAGIEPDTAQVVSQAHETLKG